MASESKGLESDSKFMDLYSRQIGAFGMETMAKLVTMRVLIVGVKGTGVEVAKNLALAGPAAITLCDGDAVELRHLGSNFFLRPDDVGKNIAEVSFPRIQELNSGVKITVITELDEETVGNHDVVVFTQGKRSELVRWNDFCRSRTVSSTDSRGGSVSKPKPIAFITCITHGLSGYVFSDFGPEFTIRDANGEAPVTRIITNISNDKEGVITLLDEMEGGRLHGVDDNDHDGWVEISEVKGMYSVDESAHREVGHDINGSGSWRARTAQKTIRRKGKEVKVFDGYKLKIGDTTKFSAYEGGGMLTQVKRPVVKNYRSLAASTVQPVSPGDWGLLFTDGAKFGRGEQLHFAFQAVADFAEDHDGALPGRGNEEDAADCVARAKALNDACRTVNRMSGTQSALALEELDEDVIKKVALHADIEVQPVACFFGGVVAQEVVKLTGKFTPLNQWLHLDFFEALPEKAPTDTAPIGSRYDDFIAIWGAEFHKTLADARTFMVGCGALGCELLKNFALLGFATGSDGMITTTDNDRIEVSNLNRQFLFRSHNVGQPKSVASRTAALEMNPDLTIKAMEVLVEPKTETTFDDRFWNSLSFVTNALDNIKARQYVDARCVFFGKALLESGTLGTKCNSLPIVPHITQSYTDGPQSGDNEDEIPMCTLRNFPSLIDHCIEWARAQFTDLFVEPCSSAMSYVEDPVAFCDKIAADIAGAGKKKASKIATALPQLRGVKRMVEAADGATFAKCVELAAVQFCDLFRDRIKDLVANFPEDHVKSDGTKFWSGAKRFPTAADLNMDDEMHATFIISAANIFAANLGVVAPPPNFVGADDEKRKVSYVAEILGSVALPEYKRKAKPGDIKVGDEDEKEEVAAGEEEEKEVTDLLAELRSRNVAGVSIEPADFEKDEDANFHIDFVYSASNMRASNYQIKVASRHKCKMIAGKIIPAIATTTASVTGLVMIEMIKILQGKPLEAFKTSSNSLGTNNYLFSEPLPPEKAKKTYSVIEMCDVTPIPDGFTKWDKTVIDEGDLSVRQFMDAFKAKVGVNCESLFHAFAALADHPASGKWLIPGVTDAQMDQPMREVCLHIYGDDVIGEGCKYIPLEVSAEDDDGEVYSVPQLIYKFERD